MECKVRQLFEVREDFKKKNSTVEGEGWGSLFGKKIIFCGERSIFTKGGMEHRLLNGKTK